MSPQTGCQKQAKETIPLKGNLGSNNSSYYRSMGNLPVAVALKTMFLPAVKHILRER